jgi:class 3 adenylate cyclase
MNNFLGNIQIILNKVFSKLPQKLIVPIPKELKDHFENQLLSNSLFKIKILCIVQTLIKIFYLFIYYKNNILDELPKTAYYEGYSLSVITILLLLLTKIFSKNKNRFILWFICYFFIGYYFSYALINMFFIGTDYIILYVFSTTLFLGMFMPDFKPKIFILFACYFFFATTAILTYYNKMFRFEGTQEFVFFTFAAILTIKTLYYNSKVNVFIANINIERQNKFISSAFSTYVSHDVVQEIISDPSSLKLGGTKRHMTAIFSDIKGFTSISEKLDPDDLVHLLNIYLSTMSDIILEEKGTIDKFQGDAIVAFFGAPLGINNHALHACISAIKMKKAETELNKRIIEQKQSPVPLITRIGLNTGSMVAGNMGTKNKMNYTVMGNSVNLAARLEAVNKQYGTSILTSIDTIRETGDNLLYRYLDCVQVVGIEQPVRLCELINMVDDASVEQKKQVKIFHEALDFFEKRQWLQASQGFNEVLAINKDDNPAKIFIERCKKYLIHPPAVNWNGVYKLTVK